MSIAITFLVALVVGCLIGKKKKKQRIIKEDDEFQDKYEKAIGGFLNMSRCLQKQLTLVSFWNEPVSVTLNAWERFRNPGIVYISAKKSDGSIVFEAALTHTILEPALEWACRHVSRVLRMQIVSAMNNEARYFIQRMELKDTEVSEMSPVYTAKEMAWTIQWGKDCIFETFCTINRNGNLVFQVCNSKGSLQDDLAFAVQAMENLGFKTEIVGSLSVCVVEVSPDEAYSALDRLAHQMTTKMIHQINTEPLLPSNAVAAVTA